MSFAIPRRFARRALITLLVFGTISSVVGAVLAIAANGAGVPLEYLTGTPFETFLVPGIILGFVVGGTQLAASISLLVQRGPALLLSAIAAFGMLIWIFAELALMREYSWAQSLYFGLGCLQMILVLGLLGVVPSVAGWTLRRSSSPPARPGALVRVA